MMRFNFIFVLLLICWSQKLRAQMPDSIYFNLYTDSLKKGSWNYINVEGRMANGKIVPLSARTLTLQASKGKIEEMSIWIDWNASSDSVIVEVRLKDKPAVSAKTIIWIRKQDLQMEIPPTDSLLQQLNERNRQKTKEKKKKTVTGTS